MSRQASLTGEGFLNSSASTMPLIYDTYLCREPANDVTMLIRNGPDEYTASLRTLQRSADYFAEKDHIRAVERLQTEMARVHARHEQWERASRVLVPLWQTLSWRRAGWWDLLDEVDWLLRECVRATRDTETLISVEWELLNKSLTPRQDYDYDLSKALTGVKTTESRPRAKLRAQSTLSCISATYAFGATEGNVGETLSSQLTLSSQAHKTSRPVVISYIEVLFEGGLKGFRIAHSPDNPPDISSGPGPAHIQPVDLQKLSSETLSITSSPLTAQRLSDFGTADLALAAGATKALSFDHVPRDAGKTEVACVTLYIKEDDFDLEYVVSDDEQLRQDIIWVQHEAGVSQKRLKNGRSTMVTVLPKPPKLRLELHDVMPAYFSNEEITIEFTIRNEEDDETDVTLDARLLGPASSLPDMTWALDDEIPGSFDASEAGDLLDFAGSLLPPKRLGKMQSFEERRSTIHIHATPEPVNFSLEIRATYHVHLDPETTLSKAVSSNISIARPFEASYNFLPLPCSEPWPNYFDSLSVNDGSDSDGSSMQMASGLIQQWSLTSRLASLAEVPLIIDSLELRMAEVPERAVCNILSTSTSSMEALLLSPRDLREHNHTIKVQKVDMDDRQVTFLNLQLEVRWHRDGLSLPPTTTRIAVPELVVPFGEPRVLASSSNAKFPPGVIHLDYVIENPSTYTLTFNLSMETSEEFAFSGPKNVSVQLVPLSRHEVRYNIMPVVKGLWISPQFRVYDTHFHKILKVNATEGMRNDKKGVSVWVDADG